MNHASFSPTLNYIHYKEWDEITYPFLNFNSCTIEVYEWISNFQGFRKSFSAWGLNFKQFSARFDFEIVGHGYKDLINKNIHVQHRCISALKIWELNQKEITNTKHMT